MEGVDDTIDGQLRLIVGLIVVPTELDETTKRKQKS